MSQHSTCFTLVQILLAYDSACVLLAVCRDILEAALRVPARFEGASKLWVQVQEASQNTNACTFSKVHFVLLL